MSSAKIVTPYQGRKRCFGEYSCSKCGNSWKSANSRANEAQKCSKCKTSVFPCKQKSLEQKYEELRRNKMEKIRELEINVAMTTSTQSSAPISSSSSSSSTISPRSMASFSGYSPTRVIPTTAFNPQGFICIPLSNNYRPPTQPVIQAAPRMRPITKSRLN